MWHQFEFYVSKMEETFVFDSKLYLINIFIWNFNHLTIHSVFFFSFFFSKEYIMFPLRFKFWISLQPIYPFTIESSLSGTHTVFYFLIWNNSCSYGTPTNHHMIISLIPHPPKLLKDKKRRVRGKTKRSMENMAEHKKDLCGEVSIWMPKCT